MKRPRTLLWLLVLLATTPAVAEGPGPGPHPQAMAFIEDRLALDDAQRALFTELKNSRREHRVRQQQASAELRQLVEAETLDQAAVAALAARMADDVESQVVDNARRMHDFQRSLTAEQREQLEKFEEWREQRGPGGRSGRLPPEATETE